MLLMQVACAWSRSAGKKYGDGQTEQRSSKYSSSSPTASGAVTPVPVYTPGHGGGMMMSAATGSPAHAAAMRAPYATTHSAAAAAALTPRAAGSCPVQAGTCRLSYMKCTHVHACCLTLGV